MARRPELEETVAKLRQVAVPVIIEPRHPCDGYCKNLYPKIRGEIFYCLAEARIIIESAREDTHTKRPHLSLGYPPPTPAAESGPGVPPQFALPVISSMPGKPTMHQPWTG